MVDGCLIQYPLRRVPRLVDSVMVCEKIIRTPSGSSRVVNVLRAADARHWDIAQVEPRITHVALSAGPDYAEVVMTPNVLPQTPPLLQVGV